MQSCSRWLPFLLPELPNFMQYYTRHHVHIIRTCTSSACHLHMSFTPAPHLHLHVIRTYMLSTCAHVIRTSSAALLMVSTDLNYLSICDLWDNLYWWFSLHVIHMLSGHMHIMHTLFAVVLDIFLPNRQCRCHPYVISSTLYIFYHEQLSFCTLSAQMHIVHVICMLSAHVHIICLSSLTLLIYLIIHNLVSAHCLHTCILSM